MHIQTFTLGDWQTHCYVLSDTQSSKAWIIDAGFEPGQMIQYVQDEKLVLEKIILTHAHLDHIAGLSQIHDTWPDVPILIHRLEQDFLTDTTLNLSAMINMPIVAPQATDFVEHGQTLSLGKHQFQVRHTPGHSPGGVTFYDQQQNLAVVGDALFHQSIGRTDFPTSNHDQLIQAIREQLLTLPDQTRVLSGHGQETTIGFERENNPFV